MGTKSPKVTVHRATEQTPHVNVELATDGDLNTRWKEATSKPSPGRVLTIEEAQRLMDAGVEILVDGKPTKKL